MYVDVEANVLLLLTLNKRTKTLVHMPRNFRMHHDTLENKPGFFSITHMSTINTNYTKVLLL